MKYFIDTEFIEGFHKPFLGKRRHFIDLVSIGIVCEDGREFYAISKDFSESKADDWVKKNVLAKLEPEYKITDLAYPSFDYERDSYPIYEENPTWKTNKQIAKEIVEFVWPINHLIHPDPEFYAYFADYDWILFCSLFGRMIDLPKGFPMFCMDLKQMMVDRGLSDAWKDKVCPEPENEHHALEDARWTKRLHDLVLNHQLAMDYGLVRKVQDIRKHINEQRENIRQIRNSDKDPGRKKFLIQEASQIKFTLQAELCELLENHGIA